MEKKQLDLDAPLLSVRRLSSPKRSSDVLNKKKKIGNPLPQRQHSVPIHKSDMDLGEVTKPAGVPFQWERIPGRPKFGVESRSQSPAEPSSSPRLPPGRTSKSNTPKLLSGEVYSDQNKVEASPLYDFSSLLETLNKEVNGEWECTSESKDEEFSDALDTLSPNETLSMDCSTSGLSGSRPCRTFSADVQTRDFMMNRFLPAAKAMVLDTPQYVPKKQPVAPEKPRPVVKKVVSSQRKPILEQQRSSIMPHNGQYTEDTESEDEDVELNRSGIKTSAKARGLFSRFCLKNSLCLLNPVPGMKMRTLTPTPTTPPKGVNRMARTAYSGPLTQIADKPAGAAVNKQKLGAGAWSGELHKFKSKPMGESPRLSYSGDLRMMRGSSPYRGFSRGGVSPYRNEVAKSPFREGVGFLSTANDVKNGKADTKGSSNFQNVPSHQRRSPVSVSGPITPTVEKTLYVDYVSRVEPPVSGSISSGAESFADSHAKDLAASTNSRRMEEIITAESRGHNFKCPKILKSESIHKAFKTVDADRRKNLRPDQGEDKSLGSLDCSRLLADGNLHTNNKLILKADERGSHEIGSSLSPLPPPLPKSPSESWLWRTLPSIPLRPSFAQSGLITQLNPKKQHSKDSTGGTKWETIVKTSNVRYDHVRYSEELVSHVSPYSKT